LDITVSARHTEVSDAVRQAVVDKVGALSRYLEGMDHAEVHFTELRNPRIPDKEVCEVVLEGHGHHVRCKVNAPDHATAVDMAVAKLEQQLRKLKTKLQRRNHGKAGRAGAEAPAPVLVGGPPEEPLDDAEAAGAARVVKVKRHALKPMTADEAALQLDLVGHDFYFFTNAETGRAAVLYRRADGDLGLIDEAD